LGVVWFLVINPLLGVSSLSSLRLSLLLKNTMSLSTFSIVTDASYVCFVDFAFRRQWPNFPDHKIKNADIIREIHEVWDPRVKVIKTKSHRSVDDAHDWHDLWTLYGNYAADFAASAALKNVPQNVQTLFANVAAFPQLEKHLGWRRLSDTLLT